ncbi:hypothetical protein BDF20DRAFT_1000335 [Mycotypha africana]|uniref:uncharacterized protein n=1 Tax=Mycotypha africana TaxID=64632 RepID=UPI0023003AD2|nr:uncharacterized protein BDF20DRAFT_1000335 [Mycotypha africana]KAI8982368.1 hypothetical protein BDF20DRAFT_1000335 [Mycotypha africana]
MAELPCQLFSLHLPHKHRPGTDLMSKHVLLDSTVINMVVETVVNPSAKDQYSPWPTEWPNGSISDVLYLPNTFDDGNLPPVLIEIQHTVDNDFLLRVMTYAISVYRQHNKKKPINITFMIGQHPSLLANPYRANPIIQQLYSIATRVFKEQIREHKPVEDLISLCLETESMIAQTIATLHEEIPDTTLWKRTKKVLIDGKLIPETYKRKYQTTMESSSLEERYEVKLLQMEEKAKCIALTYLHTQPIANSMMINWLDTLLDYDFTVIHRPGIQNILPDRLSRLCS